AEQLSGAACAVFAPSAVSLFRDPPGGSPRNVWIATVTSLTPHGDIVRVRLDAPIPLIADITNGGLAALRLRVGDRVWASVKATEVSAYRD
ncbi:MAG: TOBE domain-containing protein, partial [Sciscionella sp.]